MKIESELIDRDGLTNAVAEKLNIDCNIVENIMWGYIHFLDYKGFPKTAEEFEVIENEKELQYDNGEMLEYVAKDTGYDKELVIRVFDAEDELTDDFVIKN